VHAGYWFPPGFSDPRRCLAAGGPIVSVKGAGPGAEPASIKYYRLIKCSLQGATGKLGDPENGVDSDRI
jgi:hypothetical protein